MNIGAASLISESRIVYITIIFSPRVKKCLVESEKICNFVG